MSSSNVEDLLDEGKNKTTVFCSRCPSKILRDGLADFKEFEFPLPPMVFKAQSDLCQKETFRRFWEVDNIFTFENIGLSKDTEGLKYLICADCEIGPIGYHDLTTKLSYIALDRVRHFEGDRPGS